jgi:hypothetical protein
MNQEPKRIGRFTSSGIGALMTYSRDGKGFGRPALTYIAEKNMERKLGRSLSVNTTSKPTSWGKVCELRVYELLGIEYQLAHKTTIEHPEMPDVWGGSPDLIKDDAVCEIKSPFTLKSFCQFMDCKDIQEIRHEHPDGHDYYYQIVSNAILTGKKKAELIIYCPYQEELKDIREWINNYDGNQKEFEWINYATDYELPYLIKGGHYKNLNIISFDIPEQDIIDLTDRVKEAAKLLV